MKLISFFIHLPDRPVVLFYLCTVNLLGVFFMWSDKRRARCHRWRISEKCLFLTSIAGGSLGVWGGMYIFRHKTRHWYFVTGIPAILLLQIILIAVL